MSRLFNRFSLSAFALLALLGLATAQLPCPPTHINQLPLQLAQLGRHRDLDDSCGCQGQSNGAAGSPLHIASDLQNSIKNNMRPASLTQKPITIRDMIRLQDKVDDFTPQQLQRGDRFHLPSPAQRPLLRSINLGHGKRFGEGDLVTLIGFVIGATHSNTSGGESVNCNTDGCAGNDIHIEITAHPRDTDVDKGEQMNDEGVVAEIIPHHRPDSWEMFDATAYRSIFSDHPVMFAGQLFYDASHSPGGGPDRAAVWEVHPVYAIWVCQHTSLSQCPADKQNDASVWLPFDRVRAANHLNVQPTTKCVNNP